ncbi:uncharacterized protein A4U43_C01F32100 [Asparagus officinalis]|uniref:Uncharacterized protein n=1 Tax=Asparagus officinalis TaxID=4686 RepID=A0A5P1FXB6_ASPOF|nr:uncharacterized protein A4U43_C01F32100 [Asparagus officinalis]
MGNRRRFYQIQSFSLLYTPNKMTTTLPSPRPQNQQTRGHFGQLKRSVVQRIRTAGHAAACRRPKLTAGGLRSDGAGLLPIKSLSLPQEFVGNIRFATTLQLLKKAQKPTSTKSRRRALFLTADVIAVISLDPRPARVFRERDVNERDGERE